MADCQFTECRSGRPASVHVNEVADDGSWRIGICGRCSEITGLREGDGIVQGLEAMRINVRLREAYASVCEPEQADD